MGERGKKSEPLNPKQFYQKVEKIPQILLLCDVTMKLYAAFFSSVHFSTGLESVERRTFIFNLVVVTEKDDVPPLLVAVNVSTTLNSN